MLDKKSKLKLEKYMAVRQRNIARHIYIIHRYFSEWVEKKWKEDGWGEMRPEHIKLVGIISTEPVNNNELAKRARVSKQAMSKMVNDLVNLGYINIDTDPKDSRAKIISISGKGVNFLSYLGNCGKGFEEILEEMIGVKKTTQLIDILTEVTEGLLAEERALYWKK